MSFIENIPSLPSSNQMLYACWFRVPSASMNKARADWNAALHANLNTGAPIPPMTGIVPVSLFGSRDGVVKTSTSNGFIAAPIYATFDWVGPIAINDTPLHLINGTGDPQTISGLTYDTFKIVDTDKKLDPSFVGIDCRTDRNVFTYNFQFGKGIYGKAVGRVSVMGDDGSQFINVLFPINDGGVFWSATSIRHYQDVSMGTVDREPEAVRAFPSSDGSAEGVQVPVSWEKETGYDITPDHWHSAVLSIRIKKMSSTSGKFGSSSNVFLAIDKKILSGKQISYFSTGDNDVISPAGYSVSLLQNPVVPPPIPDNGAGYSVTFENDGWEKPSYSFTPPDYSTGLINVPGNAETTLHIEMAELDFYSNFAPTLTDGIVSLFVDDKGLPVPAGKRDGQFQFKPSLRLHASGNWKKARLTGNIKATATPVSKIKSYHPNPNLFGKQSP